MGFLDELKKLTRPYDDGDDGFIDDDEEEVEEERPRANPFGGYSGGGTPTGDTATTMRSFRAKEGRVVNLTTGGQVQVILAKPERFESAAEIADHLRAKRAVLVNLETTPKDVVRRLVDFLSGVTYAIDGSIKKVATGTYILTPPNVTIVGDQLDELSSGSGGTTYF